MYIQLFCSMYTYIYIYIYIYVHLLVITCRFITPLHAGSSSIPVPANAARERPTKWNSSMPHTKPPPDEEAETESEAEAPEWALGNEEEDDLVVKVPALKGENIKKKIWRYSLTCA